MNTKLHAPALMLGLLSALCTAATRPSGSPVDAVFAERNLGKAVCKITFTANEFPTETSKPGQIPASGGAFFLAAFQLQPDSPFPRPPVFATFFPKATKVKKA